MLKSTIFREYDIRGIADVDLPSEGVTLLGHALGTYLIRHGGTSKGEPCRITLGRDVRLSGDRLHDALLKGLLASGCHVTDVGRVPTPLLYYSTVHLKTAGGVMITGSHNPSEYNGFKTVCGSRAGAGAAIQELYRISRQTRLRTRRRSAFQLRHRDALRR